MWTGEKEFTDIKDTWINLGWKYFETLDWAGRTWTNDESWPCHKVYHIPTILYILSWIEPFLELCTLYLGKKCFVGEGMCWNPMIPPFQLYCRFSCDDRGLCPRWGMDFWSCKVEVGKLKCVRQWFESFKIWYLKYEIFNSWSYLTDSINCVILCLNPQPPVS